jgi:hypothetical protein
MRSTNAMQMKVATAKATPMPRIRWTAVFGENPMSPKVLLEKYTTWKTSRFLFSLEWWSYSVDPAQLLPDVEHQAHS